MTPPVNPVTTRVNNAADATSRRIFVARPIRDMVTAWHPATPPGGHVMVVWNEENVVHLLTRAGFGANASDIKKFTKYGQATAVEKLVTVTPNFAKGPGRS